MKTLNIDENTYFMSDLHLGHKHILKFQPDRQTILDAGEFKTHEDMVIYYWNKNIGPNDTVVLVGDFAFKEIQKYMNMLNGNIILILGNRDRKGLQVYDNPRVTVVRGIHVDLMADTKYTQSYTDETDKLLSAYIFEFVGYRILISHYPATEDDDYDRKNEKIHDRIELTKKFVEFYEIDYIIHGHTHDKDTGLENHYNVSADALGLIPMQLKTIIDALEYSWQR